MLLLRGVETVSESCLLGMSDSLAAAPRPETTRAPMKLGKDVTRACHTLARIQTTPQIAMMGRRPKQFARGTMMKFA